MDDALGVGVLQGAQDLSSKVYDLFPGQGTAALLEIFFQRDAVHILHDDVLQFVGDRYIIDLDDIGMTEDGDGLGLVLETAHQFLIVKKFFL